MHTLSKKYSKAKLLVCYITLLISSFHISPCLGMDTINQTKTGASVEVATVADEVTDNDLDEIDELDEWSSDTAETEVYDPIEPVNRFFFQFNDKLYFWGIKPLAQGYSWLVPQFMREGIENFFMNVLTPVRAANCILQLDFQGVETEFARLLINSTVGVAGFMDPAYDIWAIDRVEEDFGQTLGNYGVSSGPYLVLPFLGPSSPRDGIGMLIDSYLNPVNYYLTSFTEQAAMRGTNLVNKTSLKIGEYESLKESSIDPYIALRSAYIQYRDNLIKTHSKPLNANTEK